MAEQKSGQKLAAGWKKDPSGRHFGRYWGGEQWTDHVISAETVPSLDPFSRRTLEHERMPMQEDRTEPAPTQDRVGSWKKDPSGRHFSRYWDGWRWTEHVMSAGKVPSIDPVPLQNSVPQRTEPAETRLAPTPARTRVVPASATSESPGSPRPRPLPLRAWAGFRGWTGGAQWALGVIVCGLIIIGVAFTGGSPRPVVGNGATTITPGSVETTAPTAAAQLVTTIPPTTQAAVTVPTTPANSGAPATTPGTAPGSQPSVTSPPLVDPPTTVPQPGESTDPNSITTTGNAITGGVSMSATTNG